MEMTSARTNGAAGMDSAAEAFDPFYCAWKSTANLPLWLKLQHEIREELNKLMALAQSSPAIPDKNALIASLNAKIDEYNENVPSIHLKKEAVRPDRIAEAYESWQ